MFNEFVIYRGARADLHFETDEDTTGWGVSLTFRETADAPDPVALTVTGTGGETEILVTLTAAQTLALKARNYAIGLQRTDPGLEYHLADGIAQVRYDVTHARA
jgi:hypothetical protein